MIKPARKPEILAPAGDMPSFLAALAAGADAVYLGLKHFSARMQAENFGLSDLARMVELADKHGRRVYVAFNALMKDADLDAAGRLAARLARDARPHGLIVQEPGAIELARQAGYGGECFLSTLANVSHAAAVLAARKLGAARIILPRELSVDEIREIARLCPDGPSLEVFVHGALCWCVSGRCYWSSYMGGKSGLRGRCVQPCRRVYRQRGREAPFFSSLDLSLDVLARSLLDVPQITAWKIEGRKKGPHYVYHTALAYRLLRDEGPDARAQAEKLLALALGRPTTRAGFLPQSAQPVSDPGGQTGSGLLVGAIRMDGADRPCIRTQQELLPGDYLRVGRENERWHATLPVTRHTPQAEILRLALPRNTPPRPGTPVFLIDRREPALLRQIAAWRAELNACPERPARAVDFSPRLPEPAKAARRRPDMILRASLPVGKQTRHSRLRVSALWMTPRTVRETSRTVAPHMIWWLPPVIWQNEEHLWRRLIAEARRNGACRFVAGAPWQAGLFAEGQAELIAGPFCNAANAMTLNALSALGFSAAFVSPELSREDLLRLPRRSPLPLGAIIAGFWPVGISRHASSIHQNELFSGPGREQFWTHVYGQNTWIYPAWPIDLAGQRQELEAAGYVFFAEMEEHPPRNMPENKRPGLFNWETGLL